MEKEGQYVGGNVWEGTGSGRGRESIVAAVGGCLAESVKLGCLEGMTVVMSPTTQRATSRNIRVFGEYVFTYELVS